MPKQTTSPSTDTAIHHAYTQDRGPVKKQHISFLHLCTQNHVGMKTECIEKPLLPRHTCLLCISNSQNKQVPFPFLHGSFLPGLLPLPLSCTTMRGAGRPSFGMLASQLSHMGQTCNIHPYISLVVDPSRSLLLALSQVNVLVSA